MGVIVVGVDGSENSIAALRWAANQAALTGADVRAVFVWEFPYADTVSPVPGATLAPYPAMERAAAEKLDDTIMRAQLPYDHPVERVVLEGAASRALLDEAKDADMLVVGARGHGGFVGLLTGSVATQAVNHAAVPVAVIRA
jgi:nucleotide-binding universal stress UspA family protein